MPIEALPIDPLQSLLLPDRLKLKRNIQGGVQVRVHGHPTGIAPETVPLPVPLANPSTAAAPLARVSRADLRGLDARILAGSLQLAKDGSVRKVTQVTT